MTRVMPSEKDQNLIAGYILGDLSPEEGRALKQRLLAEPALSDEMTALQATLETVYGTDYGTELAPPAPLKNRILAAAANQPTPLWAVPQPQLNLPQPNLPQPVPQRLEPRGSASQRSAPQRSAPQRLERTHARQISKWLPYGFGAAAATLAIALGIQNYTLHQSVQTLQAELTTALATSELAIGTGPIDTGPEATLTFALNAAENAPAIDGQTGNDQTGEVTIAVNPAELEAVLNVQGLRPLPEDQVYALWAVIREGAFVTTDAKNAILMATFNVDESGNQTQAVAIPSVFQEVADVKAIAVTIESAIAPQQHQSSPILIQQL